MKIMKKYIKKSLGENGKKYSQLLKGLKFKNFITDYLLFNALYDMIKTGEVLKCYGGYYMLDKEVA